MCDLELHVQWDLFNKSGPHEVSIKEVSLFQRLFSIYIAGTAGSVLIREVSAIIFSHIPGIIIQCIM